MAGGVTEPGTDYSPTVGLIYVFNLIVGTGALTIPRAFQKAGWLMGCIVMVALGFFGYMTVTFVIETMASANAMIRWKRLQKMKKSINEPEDAEESSEHAPLLLGITEAPAYDGTEEQTRDIYEISERVEMGKMASLFFHKVGLNLFYLCIIIYLYGDMAIYAAAVPKSMRDVACTFQGYGNSSCNATIDEDSPCWSGVELSRMNVYRIFVAVFTLTLGCFTFFNVQKTKYLQIFTTLMRWIAFGMMIILTLNRLGHGRGRGHPALGRFEGIPSLFGVCVYSFMCHHSLPSLATPIKDKSKLYFLFGLDYFLILIFYILLAMTGVFSFETIQDLYTLNFQPNTCDTHAGNPITTIVPIQYFLALFPVFTLSTNFPIIGITLRNNLKTLFHKDNKPYHAFVDRVIFPMLALIPPIIVAFITHDLEILVGITGSYAGAGIQYIVPAALVYYSRQNMKMTLGSGIENTHKSPFHHTAWVVIVLVWAVACIAFVTSNHILTKSP